MMFVMLDMQPRAPGGNFVRTMAMRMGVGVVHHLVGRDSQGHRLGNAAEHE
jgi:hypothetical protein